MPTKYLIAVAAIAVAILTSTAAAVGARDGLSTARAATAGYHRIDVALAAGYGQFLGCIDEPGMGAMGIHFVNGDLVGDIVIDAATPEALVYEPQSNGRLRLVALEYIVFKAAWDAEHGSPPSLFGHEFMLVTSPNRYGLPPFYALHAWIWKDNPSGMFNPWNPRVSCDA